MLGVCWGVCACVGCWGVGACLGCAGCVCTGLALRFDAGVTSSPVAGRCYARVVPCLQVRKHVPGNPVTLAIGDGANDVDMIKQAEVRRLLLFVSGLVGGWVGGVVGLVVPWLGVYDAWGRCW